MNYSVNLLRINPYVIAALSGVLAVGGFAPWGIFPLAIVSLAILFGLWNKHTVPRTAFLLGFYFGMGFFVSGVGWIYVALHEYGHMPVLLAGLATGLFSAFLALFPAAAGYFQSRLTYSIQWVKLGLVMPAIWVSIELVRGYIMTGFPWLTLGYSQVPVSPLAGFAPVLGVYGVSLLVSLSAGLTVLFVQHHKHRQGKAAAGLALIIWLTGAALQRIEWTSPQGEPFKVSLLQGNIAQDEKFDAQSRRATMEVYYQMLLGSDARLIVYPETALPLLRSQLPQDYTSLLREVAQRQGSDILLGAFEREQGVFYNSMFSLGVSADQAYRKNHLVPFGEFIPVRSVLGWFINNVLNIPMSDLSSGGENQPLLMIAGQQIAVNICYEDVFGEEIIRALPDATLLLNTSNDAWYGESSAAIQHNQISQMRALETGRMMLRSTNTGVTSVIDRNGKILAMLPQHQRAVLTGQVQGYSGETPYVRWGNAAIFGLLSGIFALLGWLHFATLKVRKS